MSDELNDKLERFKDLFNLPALSQFQLESQDSFLEELKMKIAHAMEDLLLNDRRKLLNLLYKVDIHEMKSQEAFALKTKKQTADKLAELIIERHIQKLITRERLKREGQ